MASSLPQLRPRVRLCYPLGPTNARRSDSVENFGRTAPENETPKMASGDRRRERRTRDRFRDAETEPPPANAAEPRAFRALVRNWLERPDWLAGAGGFRTPNPETRRRPLGTAWPERRVDPRAIFIAERTGLPLRAERQCRRAIRVTWPIWIFRPTGDAAIVGLRW